VARPTANQQWQSQAEKMLTAIMNHLDYIGVMAMECFVVEDRLLINELAPRVHNSGHWTQNGASISQFELHLRALLDLPLPTPLVPSCALMINLLGIAPVTKWLDDPLVHLHWYDKTVQSGRKVGHLNLTASQPDLIAALQRLSGLFPDDYQTSLHWATQQLSTHQSA
jgi:5-(carboxyamino)imidazole ribonucleotide synthase